MRNCRGSDVKGLLTVALVCSLLALPLIAQAGVGTGEEVEPQGSIPEGLIQHVIDFQDIVPSPDVQGSAPLPESIVDDEYQDLGVLFASANYPAAAVTDYPGSTPNSLAALDEFGLFDFSEMMIASFVLPGTPTPAVTNYVGLESVDPTPVTVSVYHFFGYLIGTFDVPGNSYNFYEAENIGSITMHGYDVNAAEDDWYAIDTFTFETPMAGPTAIEETSWGKIKGLFR
jgi:hypothetical protein